MLHRLGLIRVDFTGARNIHGVVSLVDDRLISFELALELVDLDFNGLHVVVAFLGLQSGQHLHVLPVDHPLLDDEGLVRSNLARFGGRLGYFGLHEEAGLVVRTFYHFLGQTQLLLLLGQRLHFHYKGYTRETYCLQCRSSGGACVLLSAAFIGIKCVRQVLDSISITNCFGTWLLNSNRAMRLPCTAPCCCF